MDLLGSKWLIAGLLIVALILILYLTGRKSVQAEILITASPERVWSVLTDIQKVKEWNHTLVPVQGELIDGATIKYEFYQEEGGDAAIMDAKVKEVVEHELINQRGGMSGILTFDHRYILTERMGNTTVTIQEKYRGVMVPFWSPAPVERAYERLLGELKERVELLETKDSIVR